MLSPKKCEKPRVVPAISIALGARAEGGSGSAITSRSPVTEFRARRPLESMLAAMLSPAVPLIAVTISAAVATVPRSRSRRGVFIVPFASVVPIRIKPVAAIGVAPPAGKARLPVIWVGPGNATPLLWMALT